jgi:hypothetical protein
MAGRASNGESTIYKGADGRWHGYVSVGFKLDGKLDRRHLSSKSRGVVVAKVRELERQRDTGTVGETSTPSVAWWLEHWLTAIAPRRVRRGTLESYESAVRKHLIPGIGRHRLERLRPRASRRALHRPARRRLLPRLRAAPPPHPVPRPHRGCQHCRRSQPKSANQNGLFDPNPRDAA